MAVKCVSSTGIQVHPGAHGHGAHLLGPRELPNGREDLPSVRRYPTGRLCTQAVLHPRVSTSVFTESTTEAPSGWVSAVAVAPWTRSARKGDQFSTDDILARPLQSTSTECRLPPLCAEFCSEHDVWRLNVAHTFFMQVCVAGWPCVCSMARTARCDPHPRRHRCGAARAGTVSAGTRPL